MRIHYHFFLHKKSYIDHMKRQKLLRTDKKIKLEFKSQQVRVLFTGSVRIHRQRV